MAGLKKCIISVGADVLAIFSNGQQLRKKITTYWILNVHRMQLVTAVLMLNLYMKADKNFVLTK